MTRKKPSIWVTILTGGLGIALFSFLADKAWVSSQHHKVGPRFVDASIRVDEAGEIMFFVRNNSDEPLDLVQARIELDMADSTLEVYPSISKIYRLEPAPRGVSLTTEAGKLLVSVNITQAIEPRSLSENATLAGFSPDRVGRVKDWGLKGPRPTRTRRNGWRPRRSR